MIVLGVIAVLLVFAIGFICFCGFCIVFYAATAAKFGPW